MSKLSCRHTEASDMKLATTKARPPWAECDKREFLDCET